MVGEWAKGLENGCMNHVSMENKVTNQMYQDGVAQDGEIKPEDLEKLKFDKKKYLGLY